MAAIKLTKSKAQQIIEEAFLRNGYIRSRDDVRIKREGNGIYKNGFELRLVPKTKEELKLIQKAIIALELYLCKTYQFSGQLVQPIYGLDLTLQFGKLNKEKQTEGKQKAKNNISNKLYVSEDFQKIESVVCEHYHFNTDDLKSQSRVAELVLARQLIMYLAREHTALTTISIGEYLGGRSHATVLYAASKIEKMFKKNADMRQLITKLSKRL